MEESAFVGIGRRVDSDIAMEGLSGGDQSSSGSGSKSDSEGGSGIPRDFAVSPSSLCVLPRLHEAHPVEWLHALLEIRDGNSRW